jgi:hypothetical protein
MWEMPDSLENCGLPGDWFDDVADEAAPRPAQF